MDGWADCWERIPCNQGIDIDLEPLRKLARKLDYGIPLTEDDVSSGRAVIDATRSAFVSLPVEVTRAHAVTEQIQIEVDRLNLKGSRMRYMSLFSGIEAATVAWHPLGWEPVAFAEIEHFRCAVLAHHYPEVPNLEASPA